MARTKTILILLAAVMMLTSCSALRRAERAELAERAKTELIGMSKVDLLTCAGVPERSVIEGEIEFLSYTATSGRRSRSSCLVTFGLEDGKLLGTNRALEPERRALRVCDPELPGIAGCQLISRLAS